MVVNQPDIVAEITAVFRDYERALLANDTRTLDAFFLHATETVRYGVGEVQYGIDEIRAFRSMQKPFDRTLSRTEIVTYGDDVAMTATLFHRDDFPGRTGRQTQTWIRTADGWRVAAAHVSMMDCT